MSKELNSKSQILADLKAFRLEKHEMSSFLIVRPQKASKSLMWSHGIVVESIASSDKYYKWFCLCSEYCKEAKFSCMLGPTKSSSNPTKHLRKDHELESLRSTVILENKIKMLRHVNVIQNSTMYVENEMLAHEYSRC